MIRKQEVHGAAKAYFDEAMYDAFEFGLTMHVGLETYVDVRDTSLGQFVAKRTKYWRTSAKETVTSATIHINLAYWIGSTREEWEQYANEELRQVVRHEAAHALQYKEWTSAGRPTRHGRWASHGSLFAECAEKMGVPASSTCSAAMSEHHDMILKRREKYRLVCPRCGREFRRYIRKPRFKHGKYCGWCDVRHDSRLILEEL